MDLDTGQIVEISHVLAYHGLIVNRQGDRVLQVPPYGEDAWPRVGEWDRSRGVPSGATKDLGALNPGASDRVVDWTNDGTIVHEKQVGDFPKPLDGVLV